MCSRSQMCRSMACISCRSPNLSSMGWRRVPLLQGPDPGSSYGGETFEGWALSLSLSLTLCVRFFSSNCASGYFHTWKTTHALSHTHALDANQPHATANELGYAANKVMVCLGMTKHWSGMQDGWLMRCSETAERREASKVWRPQAGRVEKLASSQGREPSKLDYPAFEMRSPNGRDDGAYRVMKGIVRSVVQAGPGCNGCQCENEKVIMVGGCK
ncbi:uncharacterized protein LY79DRAFT_537371 [Colletotrichum navitas]|uniref:Uncharacterized protein n=1 Tax=Colletotrichum navitas TaxID=681940 RepID=A0AAD8V8R1_9PEZI|nr:uncharacterized protein LY79DRAFT_537371 [Colletotrichum navitas]KAK1598517.1 hypothetical protein LY79DRAFT_537371 [Colletotrichum navitas]